MKIGMMTPVNGRCVIRNAAKNMKKKERLVLMGKLGKECSISGIIRPVRII